MMRIPADLDPTLLLEIEALAVELAALGGKEIISALGTILSVKYKGEGAAAALLKDPVSQVDGAVEAQIRLRVTERFPGHDIIGEEMEERPGRGHDFTWAIDPIDGTTNFVNGFPLFASSVGVLYRGVPFVGALWCSTSHLLTPGVYHCGTAQGLRFEGTAFSRQANPAVRRRLAGEPDLRDGTSMWDVRKTGSAAIECAFVAAGLLQVARFATPNIWDVAGGVALAWASGATVLEQHNENWRPFAGFGEDLDDLGLWRRPLILGSEDAAKAMGQRAAHKK
ncbi:inositol monophosphatase [Sphingobium sufflavum]|uniref:inositol monophosphatase family protein n=1 Tax=Sphingobium sufflavum TaxID=1129547 RepID=UPI001F424C42|nr:inositol monophosphatase [Sphingobium sufflavum]MCE7798106.1 inositol monophosphatase [Sphingobium sufflavum]